MKWRNLLILASLCLLPAACADGQMDTEIPPVTEYHPPEVQPAPEAPVIPEEPSDDNDHPPHVFPDDGDIHVQKKPDYQVGPAREGNYQAAPCLIHPEDCGDDS